MTGCGIQAKQVYLFTKIDMKIKLVPSNSAGKVIAFYVINFTLFLFNSIN